MAPVELSQASLPCRHGRAPGECETCAAWESAIYNRGRAETAEDENVKLTARITVLEGRVAEDSAVCICGCPASAHESLGEDGEQCENHYHDCMRVSPAVRALYVEMRERALTAERTFQCAT